MNADVVAAGGVVWRPASDGKEIAVVHRPKYDDWSLPKGKLDEGETFEDAALREVEEETGLRAELGPYLGEVSYDVSKGRKVVRYWAMTAGDGEFTPNDEVDELRWVSMGEAPAMLTHDLDRRLVERAAAELAS